MRIDLYTKTILTLIAALLAVVALRPLFQPAQTVQAQASLANVQFSGRVAGFWLFDPHTGDAWSYNSSTGQVMQHIKIQSLGSPLVEH
jgi:hypothetical protein